jgi:microcystin degradation protein MlrC
MSLLLERGRPMGRALRKLPFLIPLNDQCTLVEPSRGVVARAVVADGDLVNLSYLAGFPPSDLYWCGPAVIAHAWSQEAADRAADALTREIALKEPEFAVPMVSPQDGVREAMAIARTASRPVVLCDTQDNPGCGATADTTGVLETLVRLGAEGAMVGYLCDAEAASAAHKAGEGADITIALGGRSSEGVTPLEGTYRVTRLGKWQMHHRRRLRWARHRPRPMALHDRRRRAVAVISSAVQALDQAPSSTSASSPGQKILALKSTCHPRRVRAHRRR